MDIRKLIERKIKEAKDSPNTNVAGGVNAVVNANVGERGKRTHTSVSSKRRVVQRGGRTIVDENETTTSTYPPEDSATSEGGEQSGR